MSDPFFRGFDRTDLVFAATAAQALATDDFASLEKIFGALGPGQVMHRKGDVAVPDAYLYISDTYVIVLIQGTEGAGQWIGQILGSMQVPYPGLPGLVNYYDARATDQILLFNLGQFINPAIATRKLVCMGFSLGGAIAQCIGAHYQAAAVHGVSVIALGSPRVGNPTFAAAVAGIVLRVDAEQDPIPTLPPVQWNGIGSAWPIPGLPPLSTYQHAEAVKTLLTGGDLVDGDQLIPESQAQRQLLSGSCPTHTTAWYLDQLLVQSNLSTLPPGGEGYVSPPALFAETQVQQGLPVSGRPNLEDLSMPSQLVQGLLYFRNLGVSEGWSESVYQISDIPTMNGLLSRLQSPRAQFLGSDCEIHAYRASYVGGTKLSQTTKLQSPQTGQYAEKVNECGDSILYSYKSNSSAHRILTFRGVPDGAIIGNKLSAIGVTLCGSIDSYCRMLIAEQVGIKVPDPSQLVQNIVSLSNAVPGGPLVVTSALAHGLTTGDHVQISGLRGYPYLLGRWKIQVNSPTTFTLNGSDRYNASIPAVGTFQAIEYAMSAPSTFGFNMVGYRKTGRPFGQPSGKRPKKLLRG